MGCAGRGYQRFQDRVDPERQRREVAQVEPALAGSVVVGAGRGGEPVGAGERGELRDLRRLVRRGQDLDASPPRSRNSPSSRLQPGPGDLVASRMRQYRLATGGVDPADRVFEARPGVRHVTGPSRGEVAGENVFHFAHMARFHEKSREVRARDQALARHVAARALVGAGDSRGSQGLARSAAHGRRGRCGSASSPPSEHVVRRVEAQRDDVNRDVLPAHRQLRAGDERDAGFVGRRRAPRRGPPSRRGR